jgi:hypothetical protein
LPRVLPIVRTSQEIASQRSTFSLTLSAVVDEAGIKLAAKAPIVYGHHLTPQPPLGKTERGDADSLLHFVERGRG